MAARRVLGGAKQPAERTRWARGKGTRAACGSKRSNGDGLIPVVPSDHGRLQRYMRAPWASCASRSSDRALLAVERITRAHRSRRCAGIAVLACKEKPCTLAQRGPVRAGSAIGDVARASLVNYIDETSWLLHGDRQWLWVMANSEVAYFQIHPSRSKAAFVQLIADWGHPGE